MSMSKAIAKMNFQDEAEVTNRLGGAKLPLSRARHFHSPLAQQELRPTRYAYPESTSGVRFMRPIKRFLPWLVAVAFMTTTAAAAATQLKAGQPFPALTFPDLDGVPKSIADFQGHKTILHIFASW
jgi:hypothetical protein